MNQFKAFVTCLCCFYLIACQATPALSPTPSMFTATSTPQQTTTPTQESTLTPTNSVTPSPSITSSPTATTIATTKPASSPSPEPVPTLEPLAPLNIRYPSMQEIKEYIVHIPVEYFHNAGSSLPPDYEVESLRYSFTTDTDLTNQNFKLTYKDVNGDDVEDLIVSDNLLLAVFLWTKRGYATPLLIIDCCYAGYQSTHSQIDFGDWTDDNVPEIIFDLHGGGLAGTGIGYSYLDRIVVNCRETGCNIIWQDTIVREIDCASAGGMSLFRIDLTQQRNNLHELRLESTVEEFSIYECDTIYSPNSLIVYTTTLASYTWNGSIFELTTETPLKEFQIINSQQLLEASNNSSVLANIEAIPNDWPYGRNDICQLFVENKPVGQPFGCKENFT